MYISQKHQRNCRILGGRNNGTCFKGTKWLLIIIPFMVTRKFSGGYHARHAYTCMMISVGLLASSFYVVIHAECNWIVHVLAAISGLSVVINSPIDSENKRLEEDEMNQYRRTTCLLVIMTIVLYFVLNVLNLSHYALCLAISLILVAILQLPCILKMIKTSIEN